MPVKESLLDKDFFARLEYLYIVTRELFVGHVSAERMSRKFGVGMEFADYRPYVAGDDFRYIDWSTYARRDDVLIKLFTEEQGAQLYFVIDASRSMSTGMPQKLFYAKKIAAALGYIGLANLDPVMMFSFDAELRGISRSFQGRGQLAQMIQFLEAIEPRGRTGLGLAARQFIQRFGTRRGMVILLSDFLDREGYEETIRLLYYHRFDLLAIRINDRDEIDPPFTGDLELVDSETGERTTIQMTPELLQTYRTRLEEHYRPLHALCTVLRRGHLTAITDTPFEELIFDVFRRGGFLR
jgi:uncharacterized protein (DUF58 family)